MLFGFRLIVILVLVLTGQTLASARGQAQIAGEMVLCTGEMTRVITVDADGNPVKRVTLCPDMANSLIQAVASSAPFVGPAQIVRGFRHQDGTTSHADHAKVVPQARDPPLFS